MTTMEAEGGNARQPVPQTIQPDGWTALRRFTEARLALGRCGPGVPTTPHLAFQAAHAQARDAVLKPLDLARFEADAAALGCEVLRVSTCAPDRRAYLLRPDLGRQLSPASEALLSQPRPSADVAIVVADGLSSLAAQTNALPVLAALLPALRAAGRSVTPIVLVEQGRVAVADPVGELFQAQASIILLGERPGLSAADSLGLYLTWAPRRGRVDSERNCISNVRKGGLPPSEAAAQATALVERMFRWRAAGVALPAELAALPTGDR